MGLREPDEIRMAWTEITRAQYQRDDLEYAGDLPKRWIVERSLCMVRMLPPPHEGCRGNNLVIPRVVDDCPYPQNSAKNKSNRFLIQALRSRSDGWCKKGSSQERFLSRVQRLYEHDPHSRCMVRHVRLPDCSHALFELAPI